MEKKIDELIKALLAENKYKRAFPAFKIGIKKWRKYCQKQL